MFGASSTQDAPA